MTTLNEDVQKIRDWIGLREDARGSYNEVYAALSRIEYTLRDMEDRTLPVLPEGYLIGDLIQDDEFWFVRLWSKKYPDAEGCYFRQKIKGRSLRSAVEAAISHINTETRA